MVSLRGDGRSLGHVAWLSIAALVYLCSDYEALGWRVLPGLALFLGLAVITAFDAAFFLIPDCPLLCLGALGAGLALADGADAFWSRGLAACCADAVLWATAKLYFWRRGESGLGRRDPALFGLAGLWVDFIGLPTVLVAAASSALLSAILAGGEDRRATPLAFGPHLALGLWLVWCVGPLTPVR